jgi:DNA-binding response OmpR family regulator
MPAYTLLVIDDHVSLARAFALALERAGYIVHVAQTAEDGLRLAQSERPAAIVLDLRMPFINGTGFLYRLRALQPHCATPVMVVTGADVSDDLRAELTALHAVLRFKPFPLSELVTEVGALLSDAFRTSSTPAAAATRAGHAAR